MMVALKGPQWPIPRSIHLIRRNSRILLARYLWRSAYGLLASGGWMLKYSVIGPVGMYRIWKLAEALENLADRLRYRS